MFKTLASIFGILIATLFGSHQIRPPISTPVQQAVVVQATVSATTAASTSSNSTPRAISTSPSAIFPIEFVSDHKPASAGIVLGASTIKTDYVTQDQLAAALANLAAAFASQLPNTATTPPQVAAGGNYANPYAAGQRIDSLFNVTVSGVAGLKASDIPSLPYLSSSGGTLTGDLTMSNATSTNSYATNLTAGSAVFTNATSTNLFAKIGHFTTGIIDTLTSTAATITNLIATTITGTNATFTNATSTNSFATTASSTNLFSTNATLGSTTVGVLTATDVISKGPTIDVRAYGAKGDGTTDDTPAIQAAINAATSYNRTLLFPAGEYKITSTLQINTRGLRLLGEGGGRPNQVGGTRLDFYGTGALIQLGTDDGLAYDANDYSGVQGLTINDMELQYSGSSNSNLTNGMSTYGTGTYGLRDWRGGSIVLDNVVFENFAYGFWGIESDIDAFTNVDFFYNSVGGYFGPRSDQATLSQLYTFYNDTTLWIDSARGARVSNSQFVGDGSATTFPIRITSQYSVIVDRADFSGNWFEHVQGANNIPAFVGVGVGDSKQSKNISFTGTEILNTPYPSTPSATYFANIENATNITIDGLGGAPENLYKLLDFTGSASPAVIVKAASGQNITYDNNGSGGPAVEQMVNDTSSLSFVAPKVGVGTTSPAYSLDVAGLNTDARLRVNAASNGHYFVVDPANSTIDMYNSSLNLNRLSSQNVVAVLGGGKFGVGTSSPYALLSISNSVITAANTPLFSIASTTGGTSTSTLMTVLANGNVGIGTSSPTQALSILGNIYMTGGIQFADGSVQTAAAAAAVAGTQGQVGYYAVGGSTISGTSTLFISTAGNVGIGTAAPTSALTLSSTASASGISLYNTVDQTTNYEQLHLFTSSNTYNLFSEKGGTGTLRSIVIGTTNQSLQYQPNGSNYFSFNVGNGGGGFTGVRVVGTHNASSGIQTQFSINPTITQTSTAGYTNLLIQPTETTLGTGAKYLIRAGTSTAPDLFDVTNSGNTGIGTSSPYALLSISNSVITAANTPLFSIASTTGGTSTSTLMTVLANGNVGIASTSPWRTISVTGTVGFDGLTGNFGAGSLCLTANKEVVYNSGSDACLSSLRSTKHDITPLAVDYLSQVAALQPVSFIYNNDASSTVRYGFIAEDAAAVDSHLGTYDATGNLSGVDDRGLLAVIVGALQTLTKTVSDFALNIVSAHVTATVGDFDQANVKKLCAVKSDGTQVCVTGDQLAAVLGAASAASGSTPPPVLGSATTPDTTPPTITINGNNPAHIHVGDSYADLGATVTDNVNQNLSLKYFLNGALVSNIVIDTSAMATDTIDYVATDNAGNTATSTRTVIVEVATSTAQ